MSSVETPFRISVPDSQLDLLQKKLSLATFPDELENSGWRYGAPLADVKRLVTRWREGYDWRGEEAKLNEELPQFTRDIEVSGGHGKMNIHYVHKRSEVENAIPLLFVHGWPGSFIEVRKILPLLVQASPDGKFPSFHVVAFSLPGYGFSEAPKKPGFTLERYAEIGNKLMLALGYNEYVTQGGDWGAFITRKIAQIYGGKNSKAWHTNMPLTAPPTLTSQPFFYLQQLFRPFAAAEKAALERSLSFQKEGMGYWMEQSTQPQTLGYSLADSPVGLLAWIYEKLVSWTDGYPWGDDEVLTWISIYYFSRAGPTAAARIYYEVFHSPDGLGSPDMLKNNPTIPMGVSVFPKELVFAPKSWIPSSGNLVYINEHTGGGHFAAHEKPELLVGDLRKMLGRKGPVYGIVPGKNGYVPRRDKRKGGAKL
ncbi:alpha/beta-hydrolase [Dendrothele bispora CBS 962.96]|uniref:Alpha/beta-hydrolase n=1 Tax=Dendrothele bispora (strain CBS 962.96) TaxID=1314807 RepID=A0A4S8M216_DENBC|nr:alpha/beta-hydrolase [Dendrothele bispora CBS 962.96]